MAEATVGNDQAEDEDKTTGGLKSTTIFRVKRKLTDDPVDVLLVAHQIKRKRTADRNDAEEPKSGEDKPVEIVLKLAGTVHQEDDSLAKKTLMNLNSEKKSSKPNPYNSSKRQIDRIREMTRNQSVANRKTNRLKVISSHRSTEESNNSVDADEHADEQSEAKELFHLYDVVNDDNYVMGDNTSWKFESEEESISNEPEDNAIVCNSVQMVRERCPLAEGMSNLTVNEEEFVYDIYYTEEGVGPLGQILKIQAIEQQFVHELVEDPDDIYDDEDDSNDESNWRNDYPDEGEVYFDEEGEGHGRISLSSDDDECQGWRPGRRGKPNYDDIYDSEISDPEHWSD